MFDLRQNLYAKCFETEGVLTQPHDTYPFLIYTLKWFHIKIVNSIIFLPNSKLMMLSTSFSINFSKISYLSKFILVFTHLKFSWLSRVGPLLSPTWHKFMMVSTPFRMNLFKISHLSKFILVFSRFNFSWLIQVGPVLSPMWHTKLYAESVSPSGLYPTHQPGGQVG